MKIGIEDIRFDANEIFRIYSLLCEVRLYLEDSLRPILFSKDSNPIEYFNGINQNHGAHSLLLRLEKAEANLQEVLLKT